MYLPVIMLSEFGWPGFLIFAVPNVLGCAAFGYVWRSGDTAADTAARHAPAMVLFSLVTVAFHVFFVGWLVTMIRGEQPASASWIVGAGAAVWLAGLLVSALPARAWAPLAVAVYAVSMIAFAVFGAGDLAALGWSGRLTATDLALLGPAIALGFVLCPYLDLTFHRMLQASPSRHAFAVFGAAFIPILLFTAAYSAGITTIVLVHIAVQSVFTVALHLRETRAALRPSQPVRRVGAGAALLIGAAAALLPVAGEDTYMRFLGPYGLIFPAYVLVFMAARLPVPGRHVAIFAIAVALLLPCYEAGFVHRVTWMTLLPVVLLLATALALRQRT